MIKAIAFLVDGINAYLFKVIYGLGLMWSLLIAVGLAPVSEYINIQYLAVSLVLALLFEIADIAKSLGTLCFLYTIEFKSKEIDVAKVLGVK